MMYKSVMKKKYDNILHILRKRKERELQRYERLMILAKRKQPELVVELLKLYIEEIKGEKYEI